MATLKQALADVGGALGLSAPEAGGTCYGMTNGCLVQLLPVAQRRDMPRVKVVIRYFEPARDDQVRAEVEVNADLQQLGVPQKRIQVSDGMLCYEYAPSEMKSFSLSGASVSSEGLQSHVDALLGAVRRAVPAPPNVCASCGSANPGEPILVNGLATRICDACIENVTSAAEQAQAAYDALPTRWGLAVPVGLGVGLLGSLAWAGIAIGTNSMFWLLAIGVGIAVGVATVKAAGKGGRLVQLFAAMVTVASVVFGNILIYAYQVNEAVQAEGEEVDWLAFITYIPQMLVAGGSDTAFAIGGGLIGAFSAVARTGRAKLTVDVS